MINDYNYTTNNVFNELPNLNSMLKIVYSDEKCVFFFFVLLVQYVMCIISIQRFDCQC